MLNLEPVKVFINKPIYGTYVAVRDTYLKAAISRHTTIEISCPTATCIISPLIWIKDGMRMEKIYLIPDKPMILYANHISKYLPVEVEDTKRHPSSPSQTEMAL